MTIPTRSTRSACTPTLRHTPLAGAVDIRRPFNPQPKRDHERYREGYRDFSAGREGARHGEQQIDAARAGASGRRAGQGTRLVDKLGGLDQAISAAAARAGIEDSFRVSYIERELSTWERIALGFSNTEAAASIGRWSGLGTLPTRLLPKAELEQMLGLLRTLGGNRYGVVAHCFCVPH